MTKRKQPPTPPDHEADRELTVIVNVDPDQEEAIDAAVCRWLASLYDDNGGES